MEKIEKQEGLVTPAVWTTPDQAEAMEQAGARLGVEIEIIPEGKKYTHGENTGIVPQGQSMVKYTVESGNPHRIFMAEVANELRKPKSK